LYTTQYLPVVWFLTLAAELPSGNSYSDLLFFFPVKMILITAASIQVTYCVPGTILSTLHYLIYFSPRTAYCS
jgi:hypothetical protein